MKVLFVLSLLFALGSLNSIDTTKPDPEKGCCLSDIAHTCTPYNYPDLCPKCQEAIQCTCNNDYNNPNNDYCKCCEKMTKDCPERITKCFKCA